MKTKELIEELRSNKVMLFDHPILNEVIKRLKELEELKRFNERVKSVVLKPRKK